MTADDRGVLVVALRRGDEVLALLEAVRRVGDRYRPADVAVRPTRTPAARWPLSLRTGRRPVASPPVG